MSIFREISANANRTIPKIISGLAIAAIKNPSNFVSIPQKIKYKDPTRQQTPKTDKMIEKIDSVTPPFFSV